MTTIEVLDADFHDPVHRDGLLSVLDSYASDPLGGGKPLPVLVRDTLAEKLDDHPTARVLLAFAGATPVGVVVCFLGFSTFRAQPLLNVHDLAVLPEWRGKGVGRALLAAAEERAQREGCCKLTLEVQEDNARARGLYASFGFADYSLRGAAPLGTSAPTRFLTKELT